MLMFEPQHTASESLIRLETNISLWITCRHSYSLSSKMISKLDKIYVKMINSSYFCSFPFLNSITKN